MRISKDMRPRSSCTAILILLLRACGLVLGDRLDQYQQRAAGLEFTKTSFTDSQAIPPPVSGRRALQRSYTPHTRTNGSRYTVAPEYAEFPQYLPISALHDRHNQKVVINALLTDELAEAVEQCIFSNDWSMKDPLVLEAQAVERYSWHHEGDWTEFKITCLSNGSELHNLKDPLADVQLRNGTQGKAPVKLELIETVAKGGVALCGPTLTTANTWMLDFVQHYQRLGVDEFHFYLPQGPVLDAFIANQKSGGSDGKGSDKIASMRFKAFEHPDVRWHNFTASPESEAFNLRAAINDCLSRLKYSHQYAVIAQADRFLHVTQKSQITSIKDLVDKHLPESTAGIGLVNLHYPRDCPITSMFIDKDGMPRIWKGIFPDSYHLHYAVKLVREEAEAYWARQYDEPETLLLSKNPFEGLVTPVVRVKDVYSANAHGPEVLMPGATESLQILPHYMAHFKHIDYLGPTSCVFGTEFNSLFLINPEAMLHVMEA